MSNLLQLGQTIIGLYTDKEMNHTLFRKKSETLANFHPRAWPLQVFRDKNALLIIIGMLFCLIGDAARAMTFTNVTLSSGLTYTHFPPVVADSIGQEASWMTGGAVAEDFNGDGWIDLYALTGQATSNLLYINQADGTFSNEAAARGVDLVMAGMGAAAGDYDNDGDIDIIVSQLGDHPVLLKNTGTGNFTTIPITTAPLMIRATSPSWGDIENDGDLDLVLGTWSLPAQSNLVIYKNEGGQLAPYEFRAAPHTTQRYIFTPRFADINNDRLQDLIVAADFNSSLVYLNGGGGVFSNVTAGSGAASDENGMGAAVGDYDNDCDLDWFVSSIFDPSGLSEANWGITGNRLYQNQGTGIFFNITTFSGVDDGNWEWGSAFGDLDNDGDLDLYHVNGWPEERFDVLTEYNNRPARLFENLGDGTFTNVAQLAGAGDTGQGRGVILFDYDNDGDLDIFICNNQVVMTVGTNIVRSPASPTLLRNDSVTSNNWLKVTLHGAPPYHCDGIGSRVVITSGGQPQMRELHASSGFLAHGPGRIAHFGLGTATNVTEVRAEWVSGDVTLMTSVSVNQAISLPSPSSTIGSRRVTLGETLMAWASGGGESNQWTVMGQVYDDPLSISFDTPGEKTLRLNVFDADGQHLYSELFSITVSGFAITDIDQTAAGGPLNIHWAALSGHVYQVQSITSLTDLAWTDLQHTYTSDVNGIVSLVISNRVERETYYRVLEQSP